MDGAPWIRLQVEGQNLPLDELGLDFYHLAENVHKARRAVYGETDEAGTAWAGEWLHAFKHDGYDAAWEKLVAWRSGWRSPKRAAADGLMNSVCERRTMILYPVGFDGVGSSISTSAIPTPSGKRTACSSPTGSILPP